LAHTVGSRQISLRSALHKPLDNFVQAGAGTRCVETPRFSLCFWPFPALDQVEEPECTSGEAGSGRKNVPDASCHRAA
jgi:hypothetical protein